MIEIFQCETDSEFSSAVKITKDYISWLDIDLTFQDIDKELSQFSQIYSPPGGLFLIAYYCGKLAGGVGLRMFENTRCEMKRLYVYEEFRGENIGRKLCTTLINNSISLRYDKMRLDTFEWMKSALELYESLGFRKIEPYRLNPNPSTVYLELKLN